MSVSSRDPVEIRDILHKSQGAESGSTSFLTFRPSMESGLAHPRLVPLFLQSVICRLKYHFIYGELRIEGLLGPNDTSGLDVETVRSPF